MNPVYLLYSEANVYCMYMIEVVPICGRALGLVRREACVVRVVNANPHPTPSVLWAVSLSLAVRFLFLITDSC